MNETNTATDPTLPPSDRYGSSDTSSTLRPQLFRMLSPRHRRVLAVLTTLAVVAAVWFVEFERRDREVQRLVYEITSAGGGVLMEAPLWRQYLARWCGYATFQATHVSIQGPEFDDEWLRDHGYLSALDIDWLAIRDSAVTASGVAGLISQHCVGYLEVNNVADCDEIATALAAEESLWCASFDGTDLSDAGFRQLPLEGIVVVSVHGTLVTPAGLLELKRCRRIVQVWLDGGQFDDAVADVLREQPQDLYLFLFGEGVTDDHLVRMEGMNVRRVELRGTRMTPEGIAALREALPQCQVRVYEDPGPVRDDAASD